jgi:hypothetical protein
MLEKRFVPRIPRGRITKPMLVLVVRDRYVVRERLNRERSFGKAVWQAAMAPIFGVDSILLYCVWVVDGEPKGLYGFL